MISMWDAMGLLFGELEDEPRRALFIGAGFAKSCAPWSPLFNQYKAPLVKLLRDAGDAYAEELQRLLDKSESPGEVTDIIERVDRHVGRVALARVILSEPMGNFTLYEGRDHLARPLPPEQPRTYPTLADWRRLIIHHSPTHLEPLRADAPNVLLGRLVAERAIDELLSTNWDALIELGVLLAGVRVEDADEPVRRDSPWYTRLPERMRVFESQDDLVGRWPVHGATALYKLHGGVRTLYRILDMGPTAERDAMLRRSFMLSATDLVRWTGASKWVEERVGATLRSHATLFIGCSGVDTVTFEATRIQIQAWEETAGRAAHAGAGHHPLRIALVDWSGDLRARNMVTARLPDARLVENVCRQNGAVAATALYVRWFLRLMERCGLRALPEFQLLLSVCASELNCARDTHPGPITSLVCQSLGFGARFTAAALGLGPFSVTHPDTLPFRRWWYAPWSEAPRAPLRACLVDFLDLFKLLLVDLPLMRVDPWTGVLTLSPKHKALVQLGLSGERSANLLLLPCPWTDAMSWASDALALELSADRFAWGTGRHLDALGAASLHLVPLGARGARGAPPTDVAGFPAEWIGGWTND